MTVAELPASGREGRAGWLTARQAALIGWGSFAVGMILRLLALWLASRLGPDSVHFAFGIGFFTFVAAILLGTASGLVGAVIVARRPSNWVGWLYVLTGVLQGVMTAGLAYAGLTMPANPSALATFFAWANGVVDFAVPFSVAALVLGLFPDGTWVSPRWRIIGLLAAVGAVLGSLEVGFGAPSMVLIVGSVNPYRASGPVGELIQASQRAGIGLLVVELAAVVAVASIAVRYRAAGIDGRRQIRWLLFSAVVVLVSSIPLLYGQLAPGGGLAAVDTLALVFAALCLAPIATLIAITRYRLYEIDRIVNRALLYGALTAILAGVFTAGIGLAQRLFVALTGVTSDGAIVLATLVVATLYAPLRKWLEAVVDRRFKFDEPRFGAYRHEIDRILSIVDPRLAAERLIREAVTELGATGGAIVAKSGEVTARAGSWPGPGGGAVPAATVPIPGAPSTLSTIVLGPRTDGAPYRAADLVELGSVAAMIARTVRAGGPAL